MPKKGWRKGEDGKFHPPTSVTCHTPLPTSWTSRPDFQGFGDRLNFLSPEAQHLHDGRLRILPPRGEKKR